MTVSRQMHVWGWRCVQRRWRPGDQEEGQWKLGLLHVQHLTLWVRRVWTWVLVSLPQHPMMHGHFRVTTRSALLHSSLRSCAPISPSQLTVHQHVALISLSPSLHSSLVSSIFRLLSSSVAAKILLQRLTTEIACSLLPWFCYVNVGEHPVGDKQKCSAHGCPIVLWELLWVLQSCFL